MPDLADKGRRLEQIVAAVLRDHDYDVDTNVIVEGRSGAAHEIDVLGEKADALTTFRVAVECKAWRDPIEKDAVAKFAYVIADAGITKGILVSAGGWRSGAGQAAAQLGVELWGPEEIARLDPGVRLLAPGPGTGGGLEGRGIRFTAGGEVAARVVRGEARGAFGLSRERVRWVRPLWVPAWCVALALGRAEGRLRPVVRTSRRWHAYEAITGELVRRWPSFPDVVIVVAGSGGPVLLEAGVRARAVTGALAEAHRRAGEVTTGPARARHTARLAHLGIDDPVETLAVDGAEIVWLPVYAALLERAGRERVVAVDGVDGRRDDTMGRVLTTRLESVRAAVEMASAVAG